MDEQLQQEHHEHTPKPNDVHQEDAGMMRMLSKHRGAIISTLIYLVIALVVFYPLTLHMGSNVPGSPGGDTYQNLWFLWWAKYAVLNQHTNVFQTSLLFWPVGASLVYQTMAPLLGISPRRCSCSACLLPIMSFISSALPCLGWACTSLRITW